METRTKLLAFGLLALIICHSCGIMGALGFQRAFAEAAPETYTVTNIIYINATGLGRTTPEVVRIEISETPQGIPWSKDGLISGKGIKPEAFEPNATVDTSKLIDVYERQSTPGNILTVLGVPVNTTGVQFGLGFIFEDEFVPINTSDFWACGFGHPALSYPAIEKVLIFRSPADYVHAYCEDNGYVLRNIINSTYLHEYDMNTLNFFQSEIIKEDIAIMRYNYSEVTLSRARDQQFEQFGGALTPEVKLTGVEEACVILAIGVVLFLFAIFFAKPLIEQYLFNEAALNGLKETNTANGNKLSEAINATKWIALELADDKDAQRQLAMNMYANRTITWDQLQYLLRQIDESYNPLINNCTTNIRDMLLAYYNQTSFNYDKYLDGLLDFTSWSNWIYDIIILAVSLLAIYFVYALIAKFRSPRAPAGSIMIVR
jgi:hypothetical protein